MMDHCALSLSLLHICPGIRYVWSEQWVRIITIFNVGQRVEMNKLANICSYWHMHREIEWANSSSLWFISGDKFKQHFRPLVLNKSIDVFVDWWTQLRVEIGKGWSSSQDFEETFQFLVISVELKNLNQIDSAVAGWFYFYFEIFVLLIFYGQELRTKSESVYLWDTKRRTRGRKTNWCSIGGSGWK